MMRPSNSEIKRILPKHEPKKCVIVIPNGLPVKDWTDFDLGWLAGFFEGEGCVKGHKSGRKIAVCIYQKDPEILFRCREFLGGSISKITVRSESTNLNSDTFLHMLNVCGDKARRFLQAIYPHVSTRRQMQIERSGGLVFTFAPENKIHCMTDERRELRMTMTDKEKNAESRRNFYARNIDKMRAKAREYEAKNRERNNARRREYMANYRQRNRELTALVSQETTSGMVQ